MQQSSSRTGGAHGYHPVPVTMTVPSTLTDSMIQDSWALGLLHLKIQLLSELLRGAHLGNVVRLWFGLARVMGVKETKGISLLLGAPVPGGYHK